MSPATIVIRSFLYHWRINLSVALGVMAATAVLTGALLVGDSMRESLKDLTLERLGLIDHALISERFFRMELSDEVAAADGFNEHFSAAIPAILLQTTIENPDNDRRAAQVTTIGTDDNFWTLDTARSYPPLKYDEVVVNQTLADELGIKTPGQEVLMRVARASQIPADSPLGRKVEDLQRRRLKVAAIIPADGLGRFSLHSNQQIPLVAFVSAETLQSRSLLNQAGKVNAMIIAGKQRDKSSPPAATELLAKALAPRLQDYGLTLEKVSLTGGKQTALEYFNLSSDQMVINPKIADAALAEFEGDGAQPAITYLANWIKAGDGQAKIPYSTITAVDSTEELGPLLDQHGKPIRLSDDQIALNSWVANDMADQGVTLVTGDRVELTYFEPESTHGDAQQQTATLQLAKIVPLAEPDQPPTLATDSHFTPEVPGLTDKASIGNWDPPFPYDADRVRSTPPENQDDLYWKKYKATPKGFISFSAGKKLWSSRFGDVTTIRIPAGEGRTAESLRQRLLTRLKPAQLGFVFRPVKRTSLAASQGTTSFSGLFIGFSFFIIAAAVMLVALLFQLGIEQRASQIGLMLAVGLRQRMVGWLLVIEGLIVADIGGVLGVALGVAYAWLMITGLKTWWVEAVVSPFLTLHVSAISLVIGFFAGVVICALTIAWTVRRMRQLPVRDLMAGRSGDVAVLGATDSAASPGDPSHPRGGTRSTRGTRSARRFGWSEIVALLLLVAAIGLFVLATQLAGEAQAGAFFAGGAAILTAALIFIWSRLRRGLGGAAVGTGSLPLVRLSARNASRNPRRSTLSIGLMASATFLIVAISAFRIDPDLKGAGGFDVLAESNRPILYDLNQADGRRELRITGEAEKVLAETEFVSLRVKSGDDASCLNLYQPQQPRILGVSRQMVQQMGKTDEPDFAWAESAAQTPAERANPWLLLDKTFDDAPDAIPVVLDKNTAMYSMHLFVTKGTGVVFDITDDQGQTIKLRIVGLLANSIFQGSLLISEENFKRLYPDISGHRLFLVKSIGPPQVKAQGPPPERIVDALEQSLGEVGLDATLTSVRLKNLLAVQNTYLSTFQSLGALGLLLGTFGLATVQLRSVLERRGELALMRSAGFRRRRLAQMVMLENVVLLLGGLLTGLVCALLAVLPHWWTGGAAVPLEDLAIYLGIVLLVGIITGFAAVRATLRAPLLSALRGN